MFNTSGYPSSPNSGVQSSSQTPNDSTLYYMRENQRLYHLLSQSEGKHEGQFKQSRHRSSTYSKSSSPETPQKSNFLSSAIPDEMLDSLIALSLENLKNILGKCGTIPTNIAKALEVINKAESAQRSLPQKIEYLYSLENIKDRAINLVVDQHEVQHYLKDLILNSERCAVMLERWCGPGLITLLRKKADLLEGDLNKRKLQDLYFLASDFEKLKEKSIEKFGSWNNEYPYKFINESIGKSVDNQKKITDIQWTIKQKCSHMKNELELFKKDLNKLKGKVGFEFYSTLCALEGKSEKSPGLSQLKGKLLKVTVPQLKIMKSEIVDIRERVSQYKGYFNKEINKFSNEVQELNRVHSNTKELIKIKIGSADCCVKELKEELAGLKEIFLENQESFLEGMEYEIENGASRLRLKARPAKVKTKVRSKRTQPLRVEVKNQFALIKEALNDTKCWATDEIQKSFDITAKRIAKLSFLESLLPKLFNSYRILKKEFMQMNEALASDFCFIESKAKQLVTESSNKSAEIESLIKAQKELSAKFNSLESELSLSKEDNRFLESKIKMLEEKAKHLGNENEEKKFLEGLTKQLENKIRDLEQNLAAANNERKIAENNQRQDQVKIAELGSHLSSEKNETARLQEKARALESKNKQLENDLGHNNKEKQSLESQNKSLNQRLKDIEEEDGIIKEQLISAQSKLHESQEKGKSLEKQLAAAKEQLISANKNIHELEGKIKDLEQKLAEAKMENLQLSARIAQIDEDAKTLKGELSSTQKAKDSLELQIKQLIEKNEKTENEANESYQYYELKIEQLNSNTEALEKKLENSDESIQKLQISNNELDIKIKNLTSELLEKNHANDALKALLEAKISELKNTLALAQEKSQLVEAKNIQLQELLKNEASKSQQLEEDIKGMTQGLEAANEKNEELASLTDKLSAQISEHEKSLSIANENNSVCNTVIQGLKNKIKELEGKLILENNKNANSESELQKIIIEADSLKKKLGAATNENGELKSETQRLALKSSDFEKRLLNEASRSSGLELDIEELKKQINGLESKGKNLSDENNYLKISVQSLEEQKSVFSEKNSKLQSEISMLLLEQKNLEEKLLDSSKENEYYAAQIAQLDKKITELQDSLALSQEDNQFFDGRVKKLKEEIKGKDSQIDQLSNGNKILEQKISASSKENEYYAAQIEQLDKKIKELQDSLVLSQEENQFFEGQIKKLKEEIKGKDSQIDQLSNRNKMLEQEISAIKNLLENEIQSHKALTEANEIKLQEEIDKAEKYFEKVKESEVQSCKETFEKEKTSIIGKFGIVIAAIKNVNGTKNSVFGQLKTNMNAIRDNLLLVQEFANDFLSKEMKSLTDQIEYMNSKNKMDTDWYANQSKIKFESAAEEIRENLLRFKEQCAEGLKEYRNMGKYELESFEKRKNALATHAESLDRISFAFNVFENELDTSLHQYDDKHSESFDKESEQILHGRSKLLIHRDLNVTADSSTFTPKKRKISTLKIIQSHTLNKLLEELMDNRYELDMRYLKAGKKLMPMNKFFDDFLERKYGIQTLQDKNKQKITDSLIKYKDDDEYYAFYFNLLVESPSAFSHELALFLVKMRHSYNQLKNCQVQDKNLTPKSTPKTTPKATPRQTPRATPTSTPKDTPNSTPKATPRGTPHGSPKPSGIRDEIFICMNHVLTWISNYFASEQKFGESLIKFLRPEEIEQIDWNIFNIQHTIWRKGLEPIKAYEMISNEESKKLTQEEFVVGMKEKINCFISEEDLASIYLRFANPEIDAENFTSFLNMKSYFTNPKLYCSQIQFLNALVNAYNTTHITE
ncbi:unnamed protein product [Blepharisma stoltei]|uniref:Uncharacterized protein n=1 Tax=Blepharisma stoltei TaxID=1481888 RepID=A0AAU9ISD3_9CILI|nr:unnamed protein product [Blepharisma stoltei]